MQAQASHSPESLINLNSSKVTDGANHFRDVIRCPVGAELADLDLGREAAAFVVTRLGLSFQQDLVGFHVLGFSERSI